MRLNQPSAEGEAWTEVEAAVSRVLTMRLDPGSTAPIVVALSGGGDSVALLLATKQGLLGSGRRILVLTVDHRICSLSGAWAQDCAERSRKLGLDHRALVWSGVKPVTGLAAAARTARHTLLADAAREAGASIILMGHTADDRLEARAMRASGSSVSEPRSWSPSPAWPAGRGVFILRPLLDVRRATIRRGLLELGETWIDDPANEHPISLRAQARRQIDGGGDCAPAADGAEASALFDAANIGWAGEIAIDTAALAAASARSRARFLSAALVSAGGGHSPPRRAAVDRLCERLAVERSVVATLAGARVEFDGNTVRVMRDDGAPRRQWTSGVFDGRYACHPGARDGDLFALGGHMSGLDRRHRAALRVLPPAARRGTPAVRGEDGSVSSALLDQRPFAVARSLVRRRLAAACGVIVNEAAIGSVGETAYGVLDTSASVERSVHEPA